MGKRVGIIGGGAAGLFTACLIRKFSDVGDLDVTILERNSEPGKKLTLTGHGRCNITNLKPALELKDGYHEAGNFIYPALKAFGPEDTVRFFESDLGMKVKEEDNNRIFPVCDSAAKVRDGIVSYISGRIGIICDARVLDIKKTTCFEVDTVKGKFEFDSVVLACGGSSFPHTGSTGDSYRFAALSGHTVIPLRAALAPVKADPETRKSTNKLSGVTVTADISIYSAGRKTASKTGEILFADFGLTGPAVMEISREIPAEIKDSDVWIELDLIPSMTEEQFDREFLRLITEHPDTKISTLLSGYIPASAACELTSRVDVEGLYAQSFTRENRKKLIREVKHLKIGIDQIPSLDRAYVTRGGVNLKEVDRKSFQSRLVPGLYIIGEALDIDGISGGYNLQACMSEAYLVTQDLLSQK